MAKQDFMIIFKGEHNIWLKLITTVMAVKMFFGHFW